MQSLKLAGTLIAMSLLAATGAFAQSTAPISIGETARGQAFVDRAGMSLYVFDRDTPGRSNCNGPCARNWPPLLAGADAIADGDYGLARRDDGALQWTFEGRPLYRWAKDQKPGDITGDGLLDHTWHLAAPDRERDRGGWE